MVFDLVIGAVFVVAILAILLVGVALAHRTQLEHERARRAVPQARIFPLRLRGVGHAELREAGQARRAS